MTDTHTPSDVNVDIAICGAGPVGLALAAMLARRGVAGQRIALIDARALGQAITDPRSIALAWGSRLLLDDVGAWSGIGAGATAIHDIHVSRRGHLGRSLMDRGEHGVDALGYVARYGDVVDALARACERAGVQVLRPLRVTAMDERADHVLLHLDDGRTVTAQVAVQAEGGVFGDAPDASRATTARPPSSRACARARPSPTAPSSALPTKARWRCCRRTAPTAINMRSCGACGRTMRVRCWMRARPTSCAHWAMRSASAWGTSPASRRAWPTRSA
jgi:2-polyprenyl-6-methoxyphenol hydroxylase-like FAD-dependent oxidoreductase